jgi:F-type H+-transporting ATPase subunit b
MAEHHSSTTPTSGAGHTEQPSHGGAFPPFESQNFLSQLLWLALAFGLLYYLMAKVALPRIESILQDRSNRLASDLDEAQRMKAEADAAGEAYEKSLRDAQNQAQGIAQEARAKLAAESDARRKAKEEELNAKLAASEATIRERTAAAMSSVRDIAGETASTIVERLTGTAPDKASLDRALDAVH